MHSKIKSAQSNSIWFAGKVAGFATSNFVAMLNPLVRSNQVQNKNSYHIYIDLIVKIIRQYHVDLRAERAAQKFC